MTSGVTEVLLVAFYNSIFWELIKEKEWGAARPFFIDQAKEATTVLYMHTSPPLV